MSQEEEPLVMLVNRITLAKVSLPASHVAEYLKKHTLYQEMPRYEPVIKKAKPKKLKKPGKPPKEELKSRYVSLATLRQLSKETILPGASSEVIFIPVDPFGRT
jgi:hypothetical protein